MNCDIESVSGGCTELEDKLISFSGDIVHMIAIASLQDSVATDKLRILKDSQWII